MNIRAALVSTLGGLVIGSGVALGVEMPLGNLANMARTAGVAGQCRIVDVDDGSYDRLTFGVVLPSADTLQVNIPRASIESWSESRMRVDGVPYWRFSGADRAGIGQLGTEVLQSLDWEVDESAGTTRRLKLTLIDGSSSATSRTINCIEAVR